MDALEVVLLLLLATGTLASCRGAFPDVLLTEVVLVVLEFVLLLSTEEIELERDPPATELLREVVFEELDAVLLLSVSTEAVVLSTVLSSARLLTGVAFGELDAVLLLLLSTELLAEAVLEVALLSSLSTAAVVFSTNPSSTGAVAEDVFGELERVLMILLALNAVVSSRGPPANFSLTN